MRWKSFLYAFEGFLTIIREEPNFRIHILALALVTGLGFYFEISRIEWLFVVLVSGLVLVTEAFNTALENLCNFQTRERNPQIKKIKDIAAAAVLIAALIALVTGSLIFIPKFF